MNRALRVGEVAARSGTSIRALHYYDELGLLRPTGRTEGGQRLYSEDDLPRLQQILTLRYLGFTLKQISELLGRPEFDLVASLRIQRVALRDRMKQLEAVDAALDQLLASRLESGRWDWALVSAVSATVQHGLDQKGTEMDRYYTPEQMKQFEELGKQTPREEIERIEQGWTALLAEVRANRDLDPASAKARDLADRWNDLTRATTAAYQAYPELLQAIKANYDRGAFEQVDRAPSQEDFAFIQRVNEARD